MIYQFYTNYAWLLLIITWYLISSSILYHYIDKHFRYHYWNFTSPFISIPIPRVTILYTYKYITIDITIDIQSQLYIPRYLNSELYQCPKWHYYIHYIFISLSHLSPHRYHYWLKKSQYYIIDIDITSLISFYHIDIS